MTVQQRHVVYVVVPAKQEPRHISVHEYRKSAAREVARWAIVGTNCVVFARSVKKS